MFDDSSNDSVLDTSSSSYSTPPSPTKPRVGRPPASLRLDALGISPKALVGKGERHLMDLFSENQLEKLNKTVHSSKEGPQILDTPESDHGLW